MQVSVQRQSIHEVQTDALVVLVFQDRRPDRLGLGELFDAGEIAGKPFEVNLLHNVPGMRAKRVLAVGAGKPGKFNAADLRRAVGAAVRHLKSKSIVEAAVWLDTAHAGGDYVAAAVEGAILGDFETDRYKTDKKDTKMLERFTVAVAEGGPHLDAAAERGRIVAESQNFARELANEPANRLTPLGLAEHARGMAETFGLEYEALDRDRMAQLGMGSLLGVAIGSAEPPALILLRYRPAVEVANSVHLGLVGKGVTFDTGGISIKSADGMEKMKYDMAGGAAMIGAMRALAQLKPTIPVTALIPAVENMPGSRAQRPGDIVTSMSGKTIEVINTDAEGRLILADAITYAQKLGCTHLVDAATLTGAIVVALGHINVGLFANDDALRERVMLAARAEGEKMWHMPLEDDYKDYLKSAFADLPNVGGRYGGAVTAAMFIKEFADPTPWVHLDIAGTAWLDDAKPFLAKGPTGVPLRTMVRLAMDWQA
ncbi:MAG TPA: leucyl aminopeptidase [Bryobacteraceae bacterium]|nr:leucyl aminopeptidase [Bryobacteraceae bacterium]